MSPTPSGRVTSGMGVGILIPKMGLLCPPLERQLGSIQMLKIISKERKNAYSSNQLVENTLFYIRLKTSEALLLGLVFKDLFYLRERDRASKQGVGAEGKS